jgi:3-oxo-5-alpha-steroid 4-dehydrogenase 1
VREAAFFEVLVAVWFALAAVIAVVLSFVSAPYGRHARRGWGRPLPFALGWVLMEAPAPLGFVLWYALGERKGDPVILFFLGLWLLHYLQRAFLYPALRRGRASPMPLAVVAMGAVFNLANSYLNGRYLFTFGPAYPEAWLLDPRFLAGVLLFLMGLVVNLHADSVLLRLRREEGGYQIPRGGLYRFVSCPNYLGELIEWVGWALATWSVPGLAFAVWTAANLGPRALSHHRWYRAHFPDYPAERRALIPFLL